MAEHHPGPYGVAVDIKNNGELATVIKASNGFIVATVEDSLVEDSTAELLAKAPELFELAKMVVECDQFLALGLGSDDPAEVMRYRDLFNERSLEARERARKIVDYIEDKEEDNEG